MEVVSLLREVATTKNIKLHPVKHVGFKGSYGLKVLGTEAASARRVTGFGAVLRSRMKLVGLIRLRCIYSN